MRVPWRDRHGRFLPLKAVVLAASFVPGGVYAFWWATRDLGGMPLDEMIHGTGLWAVRFLLISLAITPLAHVLEWSRVLLVRRIVGVTAMAYAVAHFTLYATEEKFAAGFIASEILHRFYLTLGFITLIGLVILAATSTDAATRRMGRWWKRLHRLAYPLGVLAIWHYFLQSKANVSEPVFVAGLFVWLMIWRALPVDWRKPVVAYPALAVAAGLLTVGLEFGWYSLETHIDPWRILATNETIAYGIRPAHWVTIVALALSGVIAARRLTGGKTRLPSSRQAVVNVAAKGS